MAENNLVCNISRCRKELVAEAWVTCCSHVFCLEHGQNIINNSSLKCPACGNEFTDQLDIVLTNLNPNERFKSMVLAGLSPERVLDITNRALLFWSYQMYQERLYRDSVVKTSKERTAALTDYCETVAAKHKVDIQKLNRHLDALKKETEDKTRKIEELVTQLAEKTRLLKKLQVQHDSLKRKTIMNYISPASSNSLKYYNMEKPNSEPPIYSQPFKQYQCDLLESQNSFSDLRKFRASMNEERKNNNFHFQPVSTTNNNKHNIFGE